MQESLKQDADAAENVGGGAAPLISVVVPVYRVEKFLRGCVESLLAQTLREFEIVLVNDGSPDLCPAICDEYAALYPAGKLPQVRVVHKQNAGLGMARNSGLDAATGRYVLFLDSDDLLRRDALSTLFSVAREHDAQAVYGGLCRFVQPGKYSADVQSGAVRTFSAPEDLLRCAVSAYASFPGDEPYSFGSACGALFDLGFLRREKIRFLSEREYISEDLIFNFRVLRAANCVCRVYDTFYRYRVNPDSLTQAPRPDVMERIVKYSEDIRAIMERDGVEPALAAKYAYGYAASRIRAQYKYLFVGNGSLHDKLRRAREWRSLPYFECMRAEFDPSAMSRLHRLNYSLFVKGRMRSLYTLIRLQRLQRRLTGYIGS